MSEVTYDGWSMFSQVTIVQNSGRWGQKLDLPQGYICDSSNKKMLAAAQSWARWYEYPVDENGKKDFTKQIIHEGICHEMDNSGFILELLECAKDSSQGGKLSFWNCKITHGDRSWKIGIAADLLLDVLKNTTFIDGVCQEPLFFARKNGRVGMLCKRMEAYKQAEKDQERKHNIGKGKTKKYVEGRTYETLTMKDVYLGYYWQHYTWVNEWSYWPTRTQTQEIIKLDKPKKVYWLPGYNDEKTKRTDYDLTGWNLQENCPSRKPGAETVELDGSLEELISARHKFLTDVDRGEGRVHIYLDRTWFMNTDPDNWQWPEGMKELLIQNGWTIKE